MSEWRDFRTYTPEEGAAVLVWVPKYSRYPLIACFEHGNLWGGDWGTENYADITTHWMPLPEPPKDAK